MLDSPSDAAPGGAPDGAPEPSGLARLWADLTASGWNQTVLRYASHVVLLALVVGTLGVGKMNFYGGRPPGRGLAG